MYRVSVAAAFHRLTAPCLEVHQLWKSMAINLPLECRNGDPWNTSSSTENPEKVCFSGRICATGLPTALTLQLRRLSLNEVSSKGSISNRDGT